MVQKNVGMWVAIHFQSHGRGKQDLSFQIGNDNGVGRGIEDGPVKRFAFLKLQFNELLFGDVDERS